MSEPAVNIVRIAEARPQGGGFSPFRNGVRQTRMMGRTSTTPLVSDPDAFAKGFEAGERAAAETIGAERESFRRLVESASVFQPEPSEELAALIAETVCRLVEEIVGRTVIDNERLAERATAAAQMISECDANRTLFAHPDDVAFLQSCAIALTIKPDPAIERGGLRIDCSAGWIELGSSLYLEALRAELGVERGEP
jgi:flagellar assembly protein FliH